MKRMLLALLLLGASAAIAQAQPKPIEPGRVAVVNIALVMAKYEKAARYKKDAADAKDQLPGLWKDIENAIKTCATENKFSAVLGYSDPLDKGDLDLFPNVNRKMLAMDTGGMVPLHRTARADITQTVIDSLNKHPRENSKPLDTGTDRVAVVNIGHVFTHFHRARAVKIELEQDLAVYKESARLYTESIKAHENALRSRDFGNDTEEGVKTKLALSMKQMKDLQVEVQRVLGKKQEDNLVQLWKETQAGIKTYADRHNIDVVLGYGDPLEKDLLNTFPNINRKMQAMDAGSAVPLVVSPKIDISAGVVKVLNGPEPTDKPEPAARVRIAHVNISHIFQKYERAQRFRKELEDAFAPFQKKQKALNDEIKNWQSILEKGDFTNVAEEDLQNLVQRNKRELEDIAIELQRLLGRKQEDNLVTLWREVQIGNEKVGSYFDLVLGNGASLDKNVIDSFPNISRKMQAIDSGAAVLLFTPAWSDLSGPVTETLNRWVRDAK